MAQEPWALYGGHLSRKHQVYLVDTNPDIVTQINREGLKIDEDGVKYLASDGSNRHGRAGGDGPGHSVREVYLFQGPLAGNQGVIGKTRLLTLQNGAGHEDILKRICS